MMTIDKKEGYLMAMKMPIEMLNFMHEKEKMDRERKENELRFVDRCVKEYIQEVQNAAEG